MAVGIYRNRGANETYFKLVINAPVEIQIRHLQPAALVYTDDLSQALNAINGDTDGLKVELIKNGGDITVGDVLKIDNRFWLIGIDEFLPMEQLPWRRTLAPLTLYHLVLENDLEVGKQFQDGKNVWQVIEKIPDELPFTVKAFHINEFDFLGVPPQALSPKPSFFIIPIIVAFAVGLLIYFDNDSNREPATNEIELNEFLFQRALTKPSEAEK